MLLAVEKGESISHQRDQRIYRREEYTDNNYIYIYMYNWMENNGERERGIPKKKMIIWIKGIEN